MNTKRFAKTVMGLVFMAAISIAQAQPILSIDFNERGQEVNTFPGFSSFVIGSVNGTGAQSNYFTTNIIGPYTVSLGASGTNIRYDDRLRSTPTDAGDFTQSLLLRDFVFINSSATGTGLDLNIEGLTSGQVYQLTIWSFDSGSTGNRASDWYAAGYLVRENYAFDGAVLPTNNTQYQFRFKVPCPDNGQLLIQGRRNAATSGANPGVFINAFQIENAEPDAPTIITPPVPVEAYAGESALFSVVPGGTAPFQYQWLKNDVSITDATNQTLLLTNLQSGDQADYAVIISNSVGFTISSSVTLTVKPVENITTALISYWPLDELSFSISPDITTNINDLLATNLNDANFVTGYRGNAVSLNGTNSYSLLYRELSAAPDLPASAHLSYTVALWVKGNVTNSPADCRVFSESANTNNSPLMTIGTDYQGTNQVVDIYIRNNNGSNPINHRRSSLIAFDDAWHHIAWVDDKGMARLYVDGVQDTNNFNYTRGLLTPNILTVGGIVRSNAGNWFTGLIDDVGVWGRALTTEEVNYVMTNPPVVMPPPRILSITVADGLVTLQIESADPTAAHLVEETANVSTPSWSGVTGVVLTAPVDNRFSATFTTPADTRFYRVVRSR